MLTRAKVTSVETQTFKQTMGGRLTTVFWALLGSAGLGYVLWRFYRRADPTAGTTGDHVWWGVIVGVPLIIVLVGVAFAVFGDRGRVEVQGVGMRQWDKKELKVQVDDVRRYVYAITQRVVNDEPMEQVLHLMAIDGTNTTVDVDCSFLDTDQFDELLALLETHGLTKYIPTLN